MDQRILSFRRELCSRIIDRNIRDRDKSSIQQEWDLGNEMALNCQPEALLYRGHKLG